MPRARRRLRPYAAPERCGRAPAGQCRAGHEPRGERAERFRTEPGFRSLWLAGPPRLPEHTELSDGANARIAALVHRALVAHHGLPATEVAERRVAMAVDALDDLLPRAFREDPRGDDWVLAEAARMMALYLTTRPRTESPPENPTEEPIA